MENSNHLTNETSPYLLQHARNPVKWYPWNVEAIQTAKNQDKPILLSIGYAACHWCHVMAHESFEDIETAQIMNKYFVNIKVDREERPHLDKVYQQLHQILTQQGGGWPLTVFISPDNLVPFFSGTYFPKESMFGRPSFKEILHVIAQFYEKSRSQIQEQNNKVQGVIQQLTLQATLQEHTLKKTPLFVAKEQWLLEFDERKGGFHGAPKFPMPSSLSAILYTSYSFVQEKTVDSIVLQRIMTTLEKMEQGGIYDHLGGGFFRYSVDDQWQIPHFEKMLYDNGQMIGLYAQGFAVSRDERFKNTAKGCIQWALDEMQSSEGGFYSSLDADSEGVEGKYYVWDRGEIQALLDEVSLSIISQIYGLDKPSNFEGKWHLVEKILPSVIPDSEKYLSLAKEKIKLHRDLRIKPLLDDKVLCAWNALILKGLSIAGAIFEDEKIIEEASRLVHFIQDKLFYDDHLWVSYKQGVRKQQGFLDDYAFLLDACWYYLQARWSARILGFAKTIADKLIKDFWDQEHGGFYFTADYHEKLIYRPKTWIDDALPSGGALAAVALQRFGFLLNDQKFSDIAVKTLAATQAILDEQPQFYPNLLVLLSDQLASPSIVILHGKSALIHEAQQLLLKSYLPHRFIFAIDSQDKAPDEFEHYVTSNDLSIYICSGNVCQEPLKSIESLKAYLNS